MPVVLITGCSSGFGLETAQLFLDRGWEVIATMRTPKAALFPESERLRILQLDVTDQQSIQNVMQQAGSIDVLVNNAGCGGPVPVELATAETANLLFKTNTLGTLAMIQAVLPQFRQRGSGVIINLSSSTTLKPLPLVGIYRASKAAVNALTESLAIEVEPFGIRVHLVLPGRSPETQFAANAFSHLNGQHDSAYAPMIQKVMASFKDTSSLVTHASDVAEAVWQAATDPVSPLYIAAGKDAEEWLAETR